jgi:hypothetical protein
MMSISVGQIRSVRRTLADVGTVIGGLAGYYMGRGMPDRVRHAVLRLHCSTNGRATAALLTPIMRAIRPAPRQVEAKGVLGNLSLKDQDDIAAAIQRDGFYVFDRLLPEHICDALDAYARKTPAQIEGSDRLALFDQNKPISKTYRLKEPDIVKCPQMQDIMSDPSILAVAETYLKTLPVLSGVNLWYSPSYGNAPGADAAQEFHFDFDPPPIWLLFFVYLTDVGPDNGPHVYVRGTHVPGHRGMKELLSRGYVRIPDDDIAKNFGSENVIELYGRRGTILAVDTRGMHKGKMPVIGHRLMAQLTFSCPPFSTSHGAIVPLPEHVGPQLSKALQSKPNVYGMRYRAKAAPQAKQRGSSDTDA